MKKWDTAAIETLQACFEGTEWEVPTQGNSLEEATDVVTNYITFCEEMVVPTKTVKVFSNNKPWITKALKSTLNEKKIAYLSGNKIESKLIQNKLNKQIKAAKMEYKERVEKLFLEGKPRDAWQGVKTLAGLPNNNSAPPTTGGKDCVDMAEDRNQFYCRFEKLDYTQEREKLTEELTARMPGHVNRELQQTEVEFVLRRMRPNKHLGQTGSVAAY